MIKVLLADDHQLVIDGIKLMLTDQSDIECVAEANNGKEVMASLYLGLFHMSILIT